MQIYVSERNQTKCNFQKMGEQMLYNWQSTLFTTVSNCFEG